MLHASTQGHGTEEVLISPWFSSAKMQILALSLFL